MEYYIDHAVVHEQIWQEEEFGFVHPSPLVSQWITETANSTPILNVVHFIAYTSHVYKLADGRYLATWKLEDDDKRWHCMSAGSWEQMVINMPAYKVALKMCWDKHATKSKHRQNCKWLAHVYEEYLRTHLHLKQLGFPQHAQVSPFPFV